MAMGRPSSALPRCKGCSGALHLVKDRQGVAPTKRSKGGYYFERVYNCRTVNCRCYLQPYVLDHDKRWFPGCGPKPNGSRGHFRQTTQTHFDIFHPHAKETNGYRNQNAGDDGRPPA